MNPFLKKLSVNHKLNKLLKFSIWKKHSAFFYNTFCSFNMQFCDVRPNANPSRRIWPNEKKNSFQFVNFPNWQLQNSRVLSIRNGLRNDNISQINAERWRFDHLFHLYTRNGLSLIWQIVLALDSNFTTPNKNYKGCAGTSWDFLVLS